MHCMHCRQTFKHSHLTLEDELYISSLFKKGETLIPKIKKETTPCSPETTIKRERRYSDQCGDRDNQLICWVNEELIKEGKRVRFPVPKEVV